MILPSLTWHVNYLSCSGFCFTALDCLSASSYKSRRRELSHLPTTLTISSMTFNHIDPTLKDSAFLPGRQGSPATIPPNDIPAWGDGDYPAKLLNPLTDEGVAPTPARTLEEFCKLLKLRKELSEDSEAELDLFCSPVLLLSIQFILFLTTCAIWQILSQDERLVLIFAYVLETRDLFRTLYETNLSGYVDPLAYFTLTDDSCSGLSATDTTRSLMQP